MQDSGSLAVFKVTARDQGHYKGHSGAFVTYCNISCYFQAMPVRVNVAYAGVKLEYAYKGFVMTRLIIRVKLGRRYLIIEKL